MSIYLCSRCRQEKQDDDSPCQDGGICFECAEATTCPVCEKLGGLFLEDYCSYRTATEVANNETPSRLCIPCAVAVAEAYDPKEEPILLDGLSPKDFLTSLHDDV